MGGNMKDRWSVPVTAVANEFIDTYMAAANGEYVKVYLYVLRHQGEDITIELIADALNHTESDVRRALSYWKKAGVLAASEQGQPGHVLRFRVNRSARSQEAIPLPVGRMGDRQRSLICGLSRFSGKPGPQGVQRYGA